MYVGRVIRNRPEEMGKGERQTRNGQMARRVSPKRRSEERKEDVDYRIAVMAAIVGGENGGMLWALGWTRA